jgi:hypothetical protein
MKDVVKGAALAVVAAQNSTATDHPTGTCVAPKGSESVVCTTSAGSEQAGSSKVTQNATMLNTSSSNMTGNGTMMSGNMSGNMTGMGGNSTMGK